jgi:hypothetical protein
MITGRGTHSCRVANFFLKARTHKKRTTKTTREGTKISCDGLTLGKINFWIHSKSSFTSPATCFECYDGTDTEMGRRRFQRWVGCNLGTLKKSSDFSSVDTFLPNSEVYVSIRTVLICTMIEIVQSGFLDGVLGFLVHK